MACSNIRYGPGVTQEVGMDLANLKAKKVGVYTDKTVATLPAMKTTLESLNKANVNFKVNIRKGFQKFNTHFLIYQRLIGEQYIALAQRKMCIEIYQIHSEDLIMTM